LKPSTSEAAFMSLQPAAGGAHQLVHPEACALLQPHIFGRPPVSVAAAVPIRAWEMAFAHLLQPAASNPNPAP
jgi:hypothetical protein